MAVLYHHFAEIVLCLAYCFVLIQVWCRVVFVRLFQIQVCWQRQLYVLHLFWVPGERF